MQMQTHEHVHMHITRTQDQIAVSCSLCIIERGVSFAVLDEMVGLYKNVYTLL